jgi:DNA invertase Pin-like site-specific DNA recombinase
MSTEHQQYSTENQRDAIRRYAESRGMQIVRTYSDAGRSGLQLKGRDALQQLIADVQGGSADYDAILVYDISRWGRFQDSDESAYYEYICRRANFSVHYCAEQFENDGSPVATIVKSAKRAMAAEYSRELSTKVFAGQCRLVELGYRQGGPAGYGLRRLLRDQFGNSKTLLSRGEQKSLQTDRVILVPGPEEEVAIIQEIYRRFVDERTPEQIIASSLNERGATTDFGRQWTRGTVHQVLTNPKYVGDNVYNRRSFKLKRKRVRNPPEMWVRSVGTFIPIVPREMFDHAQRIIIDRSRHYTDEEMLTLLGGVLARNGRISGILIDETPGMPSSSAYRHRFSTLLRAYKLVGYTPARNFEYIRTNAVLRERYAEIIGHIRSTLEGYGATITEDKNTGLLRVCEEVTLSLTIARCWSTATGSHRWLLRLDASLLPDITLAGRLAPGNESILDYYILPSIATVEQQLRLTADNPVTIDVHRYPSLEFFLNALKRVQVTEVA